MTWKLQAITGEQTGQEVSIDKDMLVGRSQDADLVLQSSEISRKHAALLLKDDALWVKDLGSSNGTFVNDIRIEHDTFLKDQDIVQFASLKFSVLAPVVAETTIEQTDEPKVEIANQTSAAPVSQPFEAIATAEVKTEDATAQSHVSSAAQQMNEQGMPSLSERSKEAVVTENGMPKQFAAPKPAPIPEGVDVHATPEPQPVAIPETPSVADKQAEERKNTSVGLITIVVLVILAVLAWLFFK